MESHIDFFSLESIDLHNTPEQLERQGRISGIKLTKVDKENKTGLARSRDESTDYDYIVTLDRCECIDFQKRELPCKHMYALANELGAYRRVNDRSTTLIADFTGGCAAGWKFVVRPCNYAALDIVLSPRVMKKGKRGEKSEKSMILTQGVIYNFTVGTVFYDNNIAYTDIWENALKKLKCSLQINNVTPSLGSAKVVELDGILNCVSSAIYGDVEFSVYRPNSSKTQEEKVASHVCKQDEFVKLLKTGTFSDIHGISHTLV